MALPARKARTLTTAAVRCRCYTSPCGSKPFTCSPLSCATQHGVQLCFCSDNEDRQAPETWEHCGSQLKTEDCYLFPDAHVVMAGNGRSPPSSPEMTTSDYFDSMRVLLKEDCDRSVSPQPCAALEWRVVTSPLSVRSASRPGKNPGWQAPAWTPPDSRCAPAPGSTN